MAQVKGEEINISTKSGREKLKKRLWECANMFRVAVGDTDELTVKESLELLEYIDELEKVVINDYGMDKLEEIWPGAVTEDKS